MLKAGAKVDHVYLIDHGIVNIIDPTGLFILTTLEKGSFFGEYQATHQLGSPFLYETGVASEEIMEGGRKRS